MDVSEQYAETRSHGHDFRGPHWWRKVRWYVFRNGAPLEHARWEREQELLTENRLLRRALVDLLDTCERGDGYYLRTRMKAAGMVLGLQRYDGTSDED